MKFQLIKLILGPKMNITFADTVESGWEQKDPVIAKWLYLPSSSSHFETSMFQLIEMIHKKSELIGVEPEVKSTRKKIPRHKKIYRFTYAQQKN